MRLLLLWGCLLLPGSTALEGPKQIRGFEGDTVSLQCSYGEELKKNQKYWCKEAGYIISRCSGTIYTGTDGLEVASGRVSIRDNLQERTFTVTLRNLTLEDEGKYWCGVRKLVLDKTFLVSLVVLPGHYLHTGGSSQAATSPHAATSLHTVTSPQAATPPQAATSPHPATSPHAGSSRPPTQLDFPLAKGTNPLLNSSSSKSSVPSPMVRTLAPVLVLLALLLVAGLAGLGNYVLRRKTEARLDTETEKQQKTPEEEKVSSQDHKGGSIPVPSDHLSGEKPICSEFIPV